VLRSSLLPQTIPPVAMESNEPLSVATAFARMLAQLGVRYAFGVIGGAIAQFCRALVQSDVRYFHFRHESGAAFAAAEASLALDRPVVVFCTAGPGLTNALTGMLAARWDGARVLLVSACTSAAHRGRGATQETGPERMPYTGLFTAGEIFHYAAVLDDPNQLEAVASSLAVGFQEPGGFIAHVSLPIATQGAPVVQAPRLRLTRRSPSCQPEVAGECARMLAEESFVVWAGFGARQASARVRELVDRTGAPLMCSPRAKGILPEEHAAFLGVTGIGGHEQVDEFMARERPAYVLVLGSRLGESTSFWAPELVPSRAFVHVDVSPSAFGRAYPSARTVGIQAEVGDFLEQLLARWPAAGRRSAMVVPGPPRSTLEPRSANAPGPNAVRPQVLMHAVQRQVVEGSDAIVMAESGNAFFWANHLLRFAAPGRYRVSTGFGSMGHAATGAVGAAIARGGKAVALVGDGAMLMLMEVSTAVQYGAETVWVVLNDGLYAMCDQGMRAMGWEPFGTAIPATDFVAMVRAMGGDGVRVEREVDLEEALRAAMNAGGPFVVDVRIDRSESAPTGRRNRNLMQQGGRRDVREGSR
jgi:acetolactate synthase-1/2/3 large subunit